MVKKELLTYNFKQKKRGSVGAETEPKIGINWKDRLKNIVKPNEKETKKPVTDLSQKLRAAIIA